MPKDYVNEYLQARAGKRVRSPMVCKDGAILSVQASEGHYCNPKNRVGPWTSVEVLVDNGRLKFPNWPKANETPGDRSRLWGWLQVSDVNAEIERRGGLK